MRVSGIDQSALENMGQQVLSIYQQKQLMDINAQRLAQGLPPVDSSALAAQVNVSADAAQMAQMQTMILLGVAAIVLAIYLTRRG